MYHERLPQSNALALFIGLIAVLGIIGWLRPKLLQIRFQQLGLQAAAEQKWERAYNLLSHAELAGLHSGKLYYTQALACLHLSKRCARAYAEKAYKTERSEKTLLLLSRLAREKSASLLEEGIKAFPHSFHIHLAAGYKLLKKDPVKAQRYLLKAKNIDSEHPETYFALGKLLEGQQKIGQARQYYMRCLELNPLHVEAAEAFKRLYQAGNER